MVLSKASHKKVLFELFFELKRNNMNGQEYLAPIEAAMEDLIDASGAKKALLADAKQEGASLQFGEGKVELSVGEAGFLKKLFDAKNRWGGDDADAVMEVKDGVKFNSMSNKKI